MANILNGSDYGKYLKGLQGNGQTRFGLAKTGSIFNSNSGLTSPYVNPTMVSGTVTGSGTVTEEVKTEVPEVKEEPTEVVPVEVPKDATGSGTATGSGNTVTGEVTGTVTEEVKTEVPKVEEEPKEKVSVDVSKDATGSRSGSTAPSYASFLKQYGADTQKNFAEQVRLANDDYYRSLMTYGANAEAMAGNGLVSAGISDYGNSAAYAARQGAVSAAGAAKQEADAENARSYAEYLTQLRAQDAADEATAKTARANALNSILSQGVTDAAMAQEMLRQSGYFTEEEITALGSQYAAYAAQTAEKVNSSNKASAYNSILAMGITDPAIVASQLRATGLFTEEEISAKSAEIAGYWGRQKKEAQTKTDSENVSVALDEYNNLLAGGYTPEGAKAFIQGKYGDTVAEQVASTVQNAGTADLKAQIDGLNGTAFVLNAKATLDAAKSAGAYQTDGEYQAAYEKIQNNNATYLGTLFDKAHNEYRADEVIEALGLTMGEDAETEDVMKEAISAVREQVLKLCEDGDISMTVATNMLTKDFKYEIDTILSDKKDREETNLRDACDAFLSATEWAERIGNGQLMGAITQTLLDNMEISHVPFPGKNDEYHVKFGNKTMVFYEFSFAAANKSGEDSTIGIREYSAVDWRTPYTANQVHAMGEIIKFWERHEKQKQ